MEVEEKISQFDPNFDPDEEERKKRPMLNMITHGVNFTNTLQEQHQMHLNVERIRVPEILFEPPIIGMDQAGLAQVLKEVYSNLTFESRNQIAKVRKIF